MISIGCCYNLLSEDKVQIGDEFGFPMSKGVTSSGLLLGKSARDLACQVFQLFVQLCRNVQGP